MVTIRLTLTGSRNRKTYRVIAIERRERRDGKAIEHLGFYNPLAKPPQVSLKRDRIDYWVKNGAQVSATVKKLLDMPSSL